MSIYITPKFLHSLTYTQTYSLMKTFHWLDCSCSCLILFQILTHFGQAAVSLKGASPNSAQQTVRDSLFFLRTFGPHHDRNTCPNTDTHHVQGHLSLAIYAPAISSCESNMANLSKKRIQIQPNSAELIHNISCQSKVIEHYKYC